MKQQIFIACDHAAFEAKEALKAWLKTKAEYVLHDLGTDSTDSTSYSEFAIKLALKMKEAPSDSVGVLLCGSGIGVSIGANRFKHIRAALCRDEEDAKMSRLHNNANVVCLGARRTGTDQLQKIVDVFLNTGFEGGRHQGRLDRLSTLGS
jgi:ribose 5-phosphate isomerase B